MHNVAVALPTEVAFGHDDSAALTVLAQILTTNFLHKELREKGGAYGGGASHDPSGLLQLSSYFDPHCQNSLRTLARGLQWLRQGNFARRDVDEAVLAVFGNVDAPQEMRHKGSGEWLMGVAQSQRQRNRDRYFALTPQRLVEVANRHLGHITEDGFLDAERLQGQVCVAGSQQSPFLASPLPVHWQLKDLKAAAGSA